MFRACPAIKVSEFDAKTTGSAGWVRRAGVHRYAEHESTQMAPCSKPANLAINQWRRVGAFGTQPFRCAHPTAPFTQQPPGNRSAGTSRRFPPHPRPLPPQMLPPSQAGISLLA